MHKKRHVNNRVDGWNIKIDFAEEHFLYDFS